MLIILYLAENLNRTFSIRNSHQLLAILKSAYVKNNHYETKEFNTSNPNYDKIYIETE
jgi:hypothetical protein